MAVRLGGSVRLGRLSGLASVSRGAVTTIGADFAAIAGLNSPAVIEQFAKVSGIPSPTSTEEYAVFLAAEQARWGGIIKAIGFKED